MKDKPERVLLKDYIDLHAAYLQKMIDLQKEQQDKHSEALKMLFEREENTAAKVSVDAGRHEGIDKGWGYLLAVVSILITVVIAYYQFHTH